MTKNIDVFEKYKYLNWIYHKLFHQSSDIFFCLKHALKYVFILSQQHKGPCMFPAI